MRELFWKPLVIFGHPYYKQVQLGYSDGEDDYGPITFEELPKGGNVSFDHEDITVNR